MWTWFHTDTFICCVYEACALYDAWTLYIWWRTLYNMMHGHFLILCMENAYIDTCRHVPTIIVLSLSDTSIKHVKWKYTTYIKNSAIWVWQIGNVGKIEIQKCLQTGVRHKDLAKWWSAIWASAILNEFEIPASQIAYS